MEVVNVKKKELKKNGYDHFSDWNSKETNIYIGRNMNFYVPGTLKSKWSNPFSSKKYGREKCLEMYEDYITHNKYLLDSLYELDGKVLGCWCKPEPCHGDILVKLVDVLKNKDTKIELCISKYITY
jgi:hypothetical protein